MRIDKIGFTNEEVEIHGYFNGIFRGALERDSMIEYFKNNDFSETDFELVEKRRPAQINRVVFEGKTTVLITENGKYIATCEKGDKFDREKGLLVCLAKANGYSTSDILELLENANEKATKAEREKAKRRKK